MLIPHLGPVFFYDMIRSGRRGHVIVHGSLYAGLLLGVVFLVFCSYFGKNGMNSVLLYDQSLSTRNPARFAGSFFASFSVFQFLTIVLLTPIYTATAITDERRRRTLEYLLATDLSNYEIVLGMLFSRLIRLVLVVLAGLPIISLLPLLGGVDPFLIAAGFAAAILMILGLGSLNIMVSAMSETPSEAVVFAIVLLPFFIGFMLIPYHPFVIHPIWAAWSGSSETASQDHLGLATGLLIFGLIQVCTAVCCCWQAARCLRDTGKELVLNVIRNPRVAVSAASSADHGKKGEERRRRRAAAADTGDAAAPASRTELIPFYVPHDFNPSTLPWASTSPRRRLAGTLCSGKRLGPGNLSLLPLS